MKMGSKVYEEEISMNDESTLAHPTRKKLFDFISENPGATFQLIRNFMDIPEGTLRYHLQTLQTSKRIKGERKGKNLCFYSSFKKNHPECPHRVKLTSKQNTLLDLIDNFPGATRKELMTRSRFSRREINYCLRRLQDLKLVWKIETGDGEGFEVITRDRFKDEMFKILVDRYLNGELDRNRFKSLKEKLDEI